MSEAEQEQEAKSQEQTSTPENNSLSRKNPLLQLIWDATSLGTLKECPRKYYLSILRGYTPRQNAVALDYGILLHSCLENFYRRKAEGYEFEGNVRATLREAILASEMVALREANDPVRNPLSLLVVLLDYLDYYHNEPDETVIFQDGSVGVELHFQFETGLKSSQGEVFSISGNIDRLCRLPSGVFVTDHKTTSMPLSQYYFRQYDLDNQMTIYAIAGEVVYGTPIRGVLIDGIKVKGNPEFSRYMTMRSKEACDEWLAEVEHWFKLAEYFSQVGCWPANDKSCAKYSGCPFREYCQAPLGLREQLLRDNFTKRVWDPASKREDKRAGSKETPEHEPVA